MNVVYDNFVLGHKFEDLLISSINARSFMSIDDSLTENAGMKKVINKYTYKGEVEKLSKGAKNTKRGSVAYVPQEYTVQVAQQVFDYYDEDVMRDPLVVEAGLKGMAQVMVNDFNKEFFSELAKATLVQTYEGAFSYDAVVDAIEKINLEDESQLFLIINPELKAEVRKDPDFIASRLGEILYNGQIGSICGIPVAVSKCATQPYLATKEAVTLFTKKESETEQKRDPEARENTVIARKVNVIALTDATKVVKLQKTTK